MTDSYSSLGPEVRLLDRRLFQTLVTVVKGPSLQLLLALEGESQRYTYGIIALWKHAELGASNRRTAAMSAMQAVKFQGDAGQWKMQVMAASREIYASGVPIDHFMMGCLLSSFQGKSPQVQSIMVNDINSDKVGPGMQLEELVSAYSTFMAMMNSIDGSSRGTNGVGQSDWKRKGGAGGKFKGKCKNCGKTGHTSKDCTKGKQNPVGNVDQKPPRDQSIEEGLVQILPAWSSQRGGLLHQKGREAPASGQQMYACEASPGCWDGYFQSTRTCNSQWLTLTVSS